MSDDRVSMDRVLARTRASLHGGEDEGLLAHAGTDKPKVMVLSLDEAIAKLPPYSPPLARGPDGKLQMAEQPPPGASPTPGATRHVDAHAIENEIEALQAHLGDPDLSPSDPSVPAQRERLALLQGVDMIARAGMQVDSKTLDRIEQLRTAAPLRKMRDVSDGELRTAIARAQVARAGLPADDPRRAGLNTRLAHLQKEGEKRWGSAEPCDDARATLVPASELPHGVYSQADLLAGGATPSQVTAVEAKRQETCAWTGVDPLRFEDEGTGTPAADVDRFKTAERAKEREQWMQIIHAQRSNPLAAVSTIASVATGSSVETTAQRVEFDEAAWGVLQSMAGAQTGVHSPNFNTTLPVAPETTPREVTLDTPAPGELTGAERTGVRDYMGRHGVPEKFIPETMLGMGGGSRAGAPAEIAQKGTRSVTLTDDLVVFRNFGGQADARGRWLVSAMPANPRKDLALPPGNTAEDVSTWIIPKGTEIIVGPAAPLNGLPGGAEQIYVSDPSVLKGPLPWLP